MKFRWECFILLQWNTFCVYNEYLVSLRKTVDYVVRFKSEWLLLNKRWASINSTEIGSVNIKYTWHKWLRIISDFHYHAFRPTENFHSLSFYLPLCFSLCLDGIEDFQKKFPFVSFSTKSIISMSKLKICFIFEMFAIQFVIKLFFCVSFDDSHFSWHFADALIPFDWMALHIKWAHIICARFIWFYRWNDNTNNNNNKWKNIKTEI